MFDKIIIGTANFTQTYGILPAGVIPKNHVRSILVNAARAGITTLDTAISYGEVLKIIPERLLPHYKIITKFSVLKNTDILQYLDKKKQYKSFYGFHGILVHDPQNIPLIDKHLLQDLLCSFRSKYGISKIGISVYDMKDIEIFSEIYLPDIIQIPLNPFNQSFDNDAFKIFVQKNNIEVHARSLFLQGVLLSKVLPTMLEPIKPFWVDFRKSVAGFSSPLQALLRWAFSLDWVKSWVIGISSINNLKELIESISTYAHCSDFNKGRIPKFQPVDHPLIDPRYWKTS